ncbi:MAG: S9 family peptidase [Omnitrophica WOR_2 bacterium]
MIRPIDTSAEAVWKERYRAPSIFYSTIAPQAPDRGLVWTNKSGTLQFHAWDVPSGKLRQLTNTPGGHNTMLELSPDGRWAYYLHDEKGNEIGYYVRIRYEGGQPEDITPDMPPYPSFGFSFSRTGNRLGFVTAGPEGFTIYVLDVTQDGSLSTPRQLYQMKTIGFGPIFSADGKLAIVISSEHSGKNEFALLAFDAVTGARIAELWDGEGTSLGFNRISPVPGDARILATSNRNGIERLLVWDPITGERTDLNLEISGAQEAQDWSPDGEHVIVSALNQAVQSAFLYHLPSGEIHPLNTPGYYRMFFTPDNRHIFAEWNDASHNSRLVEIDDHSGDILQTVLVVGDAPSSRSMKPVHFPSSDGQMIQGWLCLPEGDGPFPTILETHGGPTGVQMNTFNSGAQAWADHGYAFLTINYHGSITFGREFEQSIWHNLGHWEVEDMSAARDYLVKEGIARADAIFLTGWSYGGYLTLLGLGKRPDLWAGGMAGIAIADWAVQWEDTADTLRGYQEALLGGTPQDQPERYRLSSPITYVEAVRAPILIIQGRNDTRTPARPVEMYERKMKELGKEITVHWFETGHIGAFADTELGIEHQQMMMCFAQRVLLNNPCR